MFPLRDTIATRRYPVVNNAIIAINVMVYIFLNWGHYYEVERYFFLFGLVPLRYTDPLLAAHFDTFEQVFSFFSFMFVHGGLLHLVGNMWSLYIFGDNVEDRLGPFWYLVFYLACGMCSGLVHLLSDIHSPVPTVGASGAIAGVMGAYFLLYPHSKILTMVPIFFLPYFIELPSVSFVGIWILMQFLGALFSSGNVGGIAWWAHIGGFLAGIFFLKILLARVRPELRWGFLTRHKTPAIHVIHTFGPAEENNLYATLPISPKEALQGTKKLVSIPYIDRRRSFLITIPPGMTEGSILRLRGMGRKDEFGVGDLYLRLEIKEGT